MNEFRFTKALAEEEDYGPASRRAQAADASSNERASARAAHGWIKKLRSPRDKARIRVVYDGVRPLAPATAARDLPGRPLVGAVGALVAHKGHRFLVEAMQHLPGVSCVIAGEGALRGELQARIDALGLGSRVKLLGQREDVAAVMAALRVSPPGLLASLRRPASKPPPAPGVFRRSNSPFVVLGVWKFHCQ